MCVQLVSTPETNSGGEHESRMSGGGEGEGCDGSSTPGSPLPSPRTHNRSVSHDSYFNLLDRDERTVPREGDVAEEGESDLELSPESSKMFLDISELNIDFNTSEPEMKIFSEDETLRSTSIEGSLSRSTLDMENLSMGSSSTRSKENVNFRTDKKYLRDKLKHKFNSPLIQRKEISLVVSEKPTDDRYAKQVRTSTKDNRVSTLSPEIQERHCNSSLRNSPSSIAEDRVVNTTTGVLQRAVKPTLSSRGNTSPQDGDASLTEDDTSHVSEDTRSEHSFESALIDSELMAKLTKLRSSPSVTTSEASSGSVAEATVSENELFTLGSSGSNGATNVTGESSGSACNSRQLSQDLLTPATPSVSIMTESCPGNLDVNEVENIDPDAVSIGETKSEIIEAPRPTTLIGIKSDKDHLGVSASTASPETPQGDSTFLDIQYHPLSDTTEPSTPCESPFTDHSAGPVTPVARPADSFPRRGTRLSPDLSSSSADDPIDNVPIYENMDSSVASLSSADLLEQGSITPSAESAPNYENFSFTSINYGNVLDKSPSQDVQLTNTIIRKKSLPKKVKKVIEYQENNSTIMSIPPVDNSLTDNLYENVNQIGQSATKVGLLETALDDHYEDYHFSNSSTVLETTLKEVTEGVIPEIFSDKRINSVEDDSEIVYEQVKYLRRSIQEINDLIVSDKSVAVDEIVQQEDNEVPGSHLEYSVAQNFVEATLPSDVHYVESPGTLSSPSIITEMLVLPAFSSPTESTTDDATLSEASEPLSSVAPQPLRPSSRASPVITSMYDTPSADKPPQSPAHSSGRSSAGSVISPVPRPRSSLASHPPPYPTKPHALPHLSLGSPNPSTATSFCVVKPASPLFQTQPPSPLYGATASSSPRSSGSGTPTRDNSVFINKSNEPLQSSPSKYISNDTISFHDISIEESSTVRDIESVEFKEPVRSTDVISVCNLKSKFIGLEDNNIPKHPSPGQPLQRHKTSPDIMKPQVMHDTAGPHSKEAEDVPAKAKSDPGHTDIAIALTDDDATKRERIERYKEERRVYLREKYKSESFRGEKDEMLLRLKQKATSPSRLEDENDHLSGFAIDSKYDSISDGLSPQFPCESIDMLEQKQDAITGSFDRKQNKSVSHRTALIATSFLSDTSVNDVPVGESSKSGNSAALQTALVDRHAEDKNIKQIALPKRYKSVDSNPKVGVRRNSLEKNVNESTLKKLPNSASPSNHTFQRSTGPRGSVGHKKVSPEASASVDDDINVKEIVAVWGKDSNVEGKSLPSPSSEKPVNNGKFETGLYYGGNKAANSNISCKQDKEVVPRRFERGISYDPSQTRSVLDQGYAARLNRGISCEESPNAKNPINLKFTHSSPGKGSPSKRANGKTEQCESVTKKLHLDKKIISPIIDIRSGSCNDRIIPSSAFSSSTGVVHSLKKSTASSSSQPLSSKKSTSGGSVADGGVRVQQPPALSKPSSVSQQRRIKDMAAMFEGPHSCSAAAAQTATSAAAPPPKVARQSSRESK